MSVFIPGSQLVRARLKCPRRSAVRYGTLDFFLVLMRSCASRTTADLKMKTMVSISTFFLIFPRASLAFSHLTVPYICSSDTLRFTACIHQTLIVLAAGLHTVSHERCSMARSQPTFLGPHLSDALVSLHCTKKNILNRSVFTELFKKRLNGYVYRGHSVWHYCNISILRN